MKQETAVWEDEQSHTPWHLWAVGILTLLWSALGLASYIMTVTGKLDQLDLTQGQIAWFEAMPLWVNLTWAAEVWGVFFGSLLILFRSRWAVPSLIIALAGLFGVTLYQYVLTAVPEGLQTPLFDVAIWAVTLLTLGYARRMSAKGVLR